MFNQTPANGQVDARGDFYCVPASRFRGFAQTGTTRTEITLLFDPAEGEIEIATNAYPSNVADQVVLTITTDTHKAVASAILNAIQSPAIEGSGKGFVVIADVVNSIFLTSAITGVAVTIQAAAAA
mgnify:CR=1 FL=1